MWANRASFLNADLQLVDQTSRELLPGLTAILAGGHFEGSMVLHWKDLLFVADTLLAGQSAQNPDPGKPGVTSFSFMWRYALKACPHRP